MIKRYNCQEKLDASHSLGWKGWLTHSRDKAYCNSLMWDQWLTTRHFTGLSIHDLTPTTIPRQPCPAVNSYISIFHFVPFSPFFPLHFISFFSLSFLWIPLYLMFSHLFIFSHLFLIYVIFTFFLFSLFLSNFLFFISLCFFHFHFHFYFSFSFSFSLLLSIFFFSFYFFFVFLFFVCLHLFCCFTSNIYNNI